MMKLALPILLASVVMIAGIFALVPVYEASTVHTTLAGSGDVTTMQNSQFNNANSTIQNNLAINATATCSTGSFLVFYSFSNGTTNSNSTLGIDRHTEGAAYDFKVFVSSTGVANNTASYTNATASGVLAGVSGDKFNFTGLGPGGDETTGVDSGELSLSVLCRSTATATLTP